MEVELVKDIFDHLKMREGITRFIKRPNSVWFAGDSFT
jgi:hypothetical protein